MKYFRRLFIILLLIGVGIVIISRDIPGRLMGEASDALQVYYNIKKADEINSKEILIYIDDNQLNIQGNSLYMEENMDLMVPLQSVSSIFKCRLELDSNNWLYIFSGETSITFPSDENYYLSDGEVVYADRSRSVRNDTIYISSAILQAELGYRYQWNEAENAAYFQSPDFVLTAELPDSYDMRLENRLTPVRDQGALGTCWAFAALGALESSLMPAEEIIFSIDHMSLLSGFNVSQNDGGDYNMAIAYLASWKGPVLEEDDPYGDNLTDETLIAVKHLQEAINVAEKDYQTIKRMVYLYGGVQSSFYSDMATANSSSVYYNMDTGSYYYSGSQAANHDIVIVGWDDNYSKTNFNHEPAQDGAFLCRNSWGDTFGDGGYFYISYEDVNIGMNNVVYTNIEDADNYDNIYQSDLLGWIGAIGYGEESAYFSNIYTANADEYLKAAGFYATGKDTYYDLYVIPDYQDTSSFEQMTYIGSGYFENPGYYTVNFSDEIMIKANSSFAIVIKITVPDSEHPVAIEYSSDALTSLVDLSDGSGYISYDGRQWESAEELYECNICLKVFTDTIDK